MARGRKKKQEEEGALRQTTRLALEVAKLPQTFRERVNGVIYPGARAAGGLGLLVLAVWLGLRLLPPERWESLLDPDHLPVLLTVGLCVSSLLGWACMVQGMRRARAKLPPAAGGFLFVWLTMACGLLTVLGAWEWVAPDEWPGGAALAPFVRWYPPTLVVSFVALNLIALASDPEQGGHRAALGEAVLCVPYALLLLAFVWGTWVTPGLQESLEETIDALGAGAIVLQVGLAWFVTAGAAGAA